MICGYGVFQWQQQALLPKLAHDQFQNQPFVCQICTAAISLLLAYYTTYHLLAPLPQKEGIEVLRTKLRGQFRNSPLQGIVNSHMV
jgi:hypothetical protein